MAIDATRGLPSFSEMYQAWRNRGGLADAINAGIGGFLEGRASKRQENLSASEAELNRAKAKEILNKENQLPDSIPTKTLSAYGYSPEEVAGFIDVYGESIPESHKGLLQAQLTSRAAAARQQATETGAVKRQEKGIDAATQQQIFKQAVFNVMNNPRHQFARTPAEIEARSAAIEAENKKLTEIFNAAKNTPKFGEHPLDKTFKTGRTAEGFEYSME